LREFDLHRALGRARGHGNLVLPPSGPAVQLPAPLEARNPSIPRGYAKPERPHVGRPAATAC
jgi:hypothetical protein